MPFFNVTKNQKISAGKSILAVLIVAMCAVFLYTPYSDDAQVSPEVSRSVPATEVTLPSQGTLKWSSTRDMSSDENAMHHFKKHGHEFGFKNEEKYIQAANDFVTKPPEGTLTVKQVDGDQVFFNPKKNWFAVVSYKGQIRTFYRLDPKIHGYKSNTEYFNAQASRK